MSFVNVEAFSRIPGQMIFNVSVGDGEDYLAITLEDKVMLEKRDIEIFDSVVFYAFK